MNDQACQKLGRQLCQRLTPYFKRRVQTHYWLVVVWAAPDQTYHFFFNTRRPRTWQRSWPLGSLPSTSLEELIVVLTAVRAQYHFTIEYRQFSSDARQRLQHEVPA
ncbi:acetyl-CoA carboxylase [Limosilactobacillus ingluviei]|uniref:acetyl-CoA carboxylase n=1 Tax=Limosilactobacillus ingluviei TaxID=148604 RepID=UPI0024B911B6|nr:acetyl-CoA carboxylase [Limosilactobacillus ingluviei]